MPGDPFTWRMVAKTSEGHRELFVRWLDEPVVAEAGRRLPLTSGEPAKVARAREQTPGMTTWSRIPSFEIRESKNACLVIVRDLRYTWEGESGFAIERVELAAPDSRR